MSLNFLVSFFIFITGLCIGSFLNVVIYRLPKKMSLARPASHCTTCDYKLRWYDNIPVLSYIFLRGKCRNCKSKISFRYPFVELLNMVLWFCSLLAFTNFIIPTIQTNYLMFVVSCLSFSVMICVFFCDYDNMEIPDEFQLALLILGIVSFLSPNVDIQSKVFGFLVGGGFFALIALLFFLVRKREGLGFGDIKLMAVLGLLLGIKSTIITIIIASVLGAIILPILNIKNKGEKNKEYPFGTFIVFSAMIAWFVGDIIVNWYLSLFVTL